MSSEHKVYRRIICCKIKKENRKKFLRIFEDDGWTKVKILGKRGAKYSYYKNFPNKTRYHMRLYEIDEYLYLLIHYEPTFSGSPSFHIYGLFDRFKSKKENILSSEKLEFSNYQAGIDYFNTLKDKEYSILNKICEFEIDEDELKFFAMKFGYISLKSPIEILIEDLKDALISEDKEEFNYIIRKIFEIMGFKTIEMNPEFLVFKSLSIKDFTLLIQKISLNEIKLNDLEKIQEIFKITSTVLILGEKDSISTMLAQKLENLNISIIKPMNFLRIFNIYKNLPILQEQLQQLFKGGLIDSKSIEGILQTVDFSDLLNKSMEIFSYLKEKTAWTYFETLEYEFIKQRKYTKGELKSILDFLTYPLINLVLVKKEKRWFRKDREMYRAIKNFDEIQFRLKNIKKFLSKIT